jgi:glutamine synthetase adenylyltransferase
MEIGEKAMATGENKKPKWDGKSRVSNDLYRKRFDEIFGKKEQEELSESYKQSLKNKKEREDNEEYLKELKDKL